MKNDFTMIYLSLREDFRRYDGLKVTQNENVTSQKTAITHNVDILIREQSPSHGAGILSIINCQKMNEDLTETDLYEMFKLVKDLDAGCGIILSQYEIPNTLKQDMEMYQGIVKIENPKNLIAENFLPSFLDIDKYAPMIIEIETNKFLKSLGLSKKDKHPHNELQRFLVNLASKYRCVGEMEFHINSPLRSGYIDLVWKKNKRIFLAIEIDFSNREKSILKLLGVDAEYRIWLYFGNLNPMNDLKRLDPQGKIHFLEPIL